MEEKNIKIFVSHRIDKVSQVVDNPLYVNVRCGAVYDDRAPEEYGDILGDDTGDNISKDRNKLCELTVQYWAWKNEYADYYGLCHYRRYLSFSKKKYPVEEGEHDIGCVKVNVLSKHNQIKYGLQEDIMREQIECNDLICMEPISLKKYGIKSNYDGMAKAHDWHNMDDVDRVIEIAKKQYPEMSKAIDDYFFESDNSWLYNCWVMSRELFNQFCEFQFSVLEELEGTIDYTNYSNQKMRACGVIGERLFGVFVTYISSLKKYKIKYNQLLIVDNPSPKQELECCKEHNNVPIVTISSNWYVPYLATFIQSIICNASQENNYEIIVLEKEISKSNKIRLEELISQHKNISLKFYNPIYEIGDCDFYIASVNYTEETYYRVLTPWILKNYSKAIVMDADIVFNEDPAGLYRESVDDVLAAVCKDVVYQGFLNGAVPGTYEYAKTKMKMNNPYDYLNTGVMLVNLEEFRKNYKAQEVLDVCQKNKFRIQEQDALNVVLEGRCKFLNIRWNFYTRGNDFINKCIDLAPAAGQSDYEKAEMNPALYHYANLPKPWSDPAVLYGDKWWNYCRMTSFYEECLSRMVSDRANAFYYMYNAVDGRTGARKIADKLLPYNSRRRRFVKKLIPRDSLQWKIAKSVYFIIRPEYKKKKK